MDLNKYKAFVKRNKLLVQNFSYVSLLEVFVLISPLITYPYLVRTLGKDTYGLILTATVLVSYASIIIDFGSNSVCAKHVSINRDDSRKLSEIICNVFLVRLTFWLLSFIIYMIVVMIVPDYRAYKMLFFVSYGLTIYDLLFPQYFFQGIEKMKYSTMINLGIKLFFILLIFVVVKDSSDYIWVPLLYSIGYILAGIFSMYILFKKMELPIVRPTIKSMLYYIKDSSPIFATDLIKTVKDKLNVLILGGMSGMANVVVYDLGIKLCNIMAKPVSVVGVVLFPRLAKSHNIIEFKKLLKFMAIIMMVIIVVVNIFLPRIADFFLNSQDDILPLRLFTIAPFFLAIGSFINSNLCVAFGYNRYVLYSIMLTTAAYLLLFVFFMVTGKLTNIYGFVYLAIISYIVEFLYRCWVYRKIVKQKQ